MDVSEVQVERDPESGSQWQLGATTVRGFLAPTRDSVAASASSTAKWLTDFGLVRPMRDKRTECPSRHSVYTRDGIRRPFADWKARDKSLQSGDALVLKNPHHDAAVLGFTVCCFILDHLATLAHRARSQHVRKWSMPLL